MIVVSARKKCYTFSKDIRKKHSNHIGNKTNAFYSNVSSNMRRFIVILISILISQSVVSQNLKKYNSLEEAFNEPDSVQILILDGNKLTSLPDSITQFVNLEVLDISVNNFKSIPPVIFMMTSLKELYLSGAYSYIDEYERWDYLIDTIPQEISNLSNLEVLDLSYNRISHIPQEIGQLSKLKKLDLYHNSLTGKSLIEISMLNELTVLDIGGNDIAFLPEEFASLNQLVSLYLDNSWSEGVPVGTCLTSFPELICELSQLQSLSLAGQCLKVVPSSIGRLKELRNLNLYANELTQLPNEISNLANLKKLNIDLICLGRMTELCSIPFVFPEHICRLKNLEELHFDSRNVELNEKERLIHCLPHLTYND